MKKLNNKKGFTLIELLAVIVILAIVTVIATQSILPYMQNAGKDAFAAEVNIAIDGASSAMSLISLNEVSDSYYTETTSGTNTIYCFDLSDLKALGLFSKGDTSYEGKVTVTVPNNSHAYTYSANMKSSQYFVSSTSGNVTSSNVNDISSVGSTSFAC